MEARPRILCGIPSYGGVSHLMFLSWNTLDKGGSDFNLAYVPRLIVDRARNMIVRDALRAGMDYVLFIDDDMVFPPDALTRLLERDVDIVGGLFFQRVEPVNQIVYDLKTSPDGAVSFEKIPADRILAAEEKKALLECDGIGSGFTLIKTSVFRKLQELDPNQPFYKTVGDEKTFMSEDLFFCWRARMSGFKIYCDTSVKVGHEGSKVYGFDDWKRNLERQGSSPRPA